MFEYIKNTLGIKEKCDIELAKINAARQQAEIDYIAMMTDVDLSGGDDTQGGMQQ